MSGDHTAHLCTMLINDKDASYSKGHVGALIVKHHILQLCQHLDQQQAVDPVLGS